MTQSTRRCKTKLLLLAVCVLPLFFFAGCAFSKNLLGKSSLPNPVLPLATPASPEVAKPDCAVPVTQPKPPELTAYPVAPPAAVQATLSAAPANNAHAQQVMQQQPAMQQQIAMLPQYAQPQPMMQPVIMQQPPVGFVQQPVQQPVITQQPPVGFVQQPIAPSASETAGVATTTTEAFQPGQPQTNPPQTLLPQVMPALTATISPGPDQPEYEVVDPNARTLPAATITPSPVHPNEVSNSAMTAAPASAFRAQSRSVSTVAPNCPPGMVPSYVCGTDVISSPEKLAECEKQVFEMNRRLSELQYSTMKANLTMEQMKAQQQQLMIDNELLRRRAELADKRYLEDLDSLSEIVDEVVSQAGSGRKSSTAEKSSPPVNPIRTVPQSATGQSL